MGTGIEWTDATWNPMTGCQKISEGCRWCYADTMAKRIQGNYRKLEGEGKPIPAGIKRYRDGFAPAFHPDALGEPLRWMKPRRVFVCSMSDLFHTSFSFEQIAAVFGVMAACPQHQFQVLTKRVDRALKFYEWLQDRIEYHGGWCPGGAAQVCFMEAMKYTSEISLGQMMGEVDERVPWPLPNVWVGVTVENQRAADERIPLLLKVPAAVRFLSCEPLIGPVDLVETFEDVIGSLGAGRLCDTWTLHGNSMDWVIAGGESGPKARPSHPDWFRQLRDQCQAAGVAFFFKQWGRWHPTFPLYHDQDSWVDDNHDQELFAEGPWTDRGVVLHRNGQRTEDWEGQPSVDGNPWLMDPVGKGKAGRVLDGRTWDEYPEQKREAVDGCCPSSPGLETPAYTG